MRAKINILGITFLLLLVLKYPGGRLGGFCSLLVDVLVIGGRGTRGFGLDCGVSISNPKLSKNN